MTHAHHHIHKRKRKIKPIRKIQRKKDPLKYYIDHIVYAVGAFVPFMGLIQSGKIWSEKSAEGISVIAYSGYIVANLVWLVYGVVHKEKPLVFMYILLFVINITIVVGAFIYG